MLTLPWIRRRHANFRLVCLHLDYGNRREAARESAYVRRYVQRIGQDAVVRVLELGGGRGKVARDDYEKASRNARYGWYKETLAEYGAPAILLGHHLGDVEENVLSNVMNGACVLGLAV